MKMIRTDGVVIREQPIREQDRLVTILTRESGLIRAFANGARNPKNKNLAATSLLTYGSYSIAETGKGVLVIRESSAQESFFDLRSDLVRLSLAQYFAEIACDLAPKEQPAGEMLSLLLNAVHLLTTGKRDLSILKAGYELRFCALAGFMPSLVACDNCGAFESDVMKFCVSSGRLFCGDCVPHEAFLPVRISVVRAMRHICLSEPQRVFSFRLPKDAAEELADVAERYLRAVSGMNYKTLQFYKTMTN